MGGIKIEVIKLPKRLGNDRQTYNFLCKFFNVKIEKETIILDFKELQFIEGNICAILGMVIDYFSYTKKVEVINIKQEIIDFFGKNCFSEKINLCFCEDKYHTSIRYKEFSENRDDDKIGEYIEEVLENRGFSLQNDIIKERLTNCIFELFENAYFHGKTNAIYTCGQFFPQKKKLIFSIVDLGKTIPENVLKKEKFIRDCECIEWAMRYLNSTKELVNGYPGGSGLFLLEEFIAERNGWVQVISRNGIYEKRFKHDTIIYINDLEHSFPGTIITFCIEYKNDNMFYIQATQEEDLDEVIMKLFRREFYGERN